MVGLYYGSVHELCSVVETFSPPLVDQYTFFGRVVTFHCGINISGYSLSIVAFKENDEAQTIHNTGDDTSALTGTFTLTQDNNGTRVTCIAAAADLSIETSSAFAYGQGIYVSNKT